MGDGCVKLGPLACEKSGPHEGLHVCVVLIRGVASVVWWDDDGQVLYEGCPKPPPDMTSAMIEAAKQLAPPASTVPVAVPDSPIKAEPPRLVYQSSDGEPCTACGGLMIRTGTCLTCQQCGENTGCG